MRRLTRPVATAAERAALFLLFFFRDSGNDQVEDLTNDVVHCERDGKNIPPEKRRTDYFLRSIVLCFMAIVPNLETASMQRAVGRWSEERTTPSQRKKRCWSAMRFKVKEPRVANVCSDQRGHSPSRPAFISSLVRYTGIIIRISTWSKIGSSSHWGWKNAHANKRWPSLSIIRIVG